MEASIKNAFCTNSNVATNFKSLKLSEIQLKAHKETEVFDYYAPKIID